MTQPLTLADFFQTHLGGLGLHGQQGLGVTPGEAGIRDALTEG
ncbi:hypothetical protein [Aeromonas sanarellii]|nr:hypothetical protein [Aeromonas sanarellii]